MNFAQELRMKDRHRKSCFSSKLNSHKTKMLFYFIRLDNPKKVKCIASRRDWKLETGKIFTEFHLL